MYSILSSNISAKEKIIMFLTYTIAVVVALTVHEFSHAFVAYKSGDKTAKLAGRLSFNPIVHFDTLGIISFVLFGFGWAKPVPINPYNFKNVKRDTLLVSLAGIISNFILAFCFYPLALAFQNLYLSTGTTILLVFYYLFVFLFQANLVLMVFNLLPIYPLDGFNAIASQVKYNNPYVTFNYKYGTLLLIALAFVFSFTNLFSILVNFFGTPISAFWGLFF